MRQHFRKLLGVAFAFVLICSTGYVFAEDTGAKIITTDAIANSYLQEASEGRIVYTDDQGLYGFMDYNGNVVIPAKYNYANGYHDGIALVTADDGELFIDMDGNVIFTAQDIYDEINDSDASIYYFNDGLARVSTYDSVGYINTKGEFIVELGPYYSGSDFEDGAAQIYDQDGNEFMIDTEGNKIFDMDPNLSYYGFNNGLAMVYNMDNGQYGYVNKSGETVVPFTLDDAFTFQSGYAIYQELGKYGVIDTEGNFVILPSYQNIHITDNGLAYAFDGVSTVLLNKDMQPIRRVMGDITPNIWGDLIIEDSGNGNYVYMDYAGNEIGTFEDYWYLGDDIFYSGGSEIIDVKEMNMDYAADTSLPYALDYSYKFIDENGQVKLDMSEYDSVRPFSDGRAVVEKNGKFGYIDTDGNVVIPIKYLYASDFIDGVANVETIEAYLDIDVDGNSVDTYGDYTDDSESDYYVFSAGYYGDSGLANEKTSQIVLPAKYYNITNYGQDVFELVDEDYMYGFYNAKDDILVEPKYEYLTLVPEMGVAIYQTEDYTYGLIDLEGNVVLEANYDSIYTLSDDLLEVTKDYQSGVVNHEGTVIVKPQYDYVSASQVSGELVVISTETDSDTHMMLYNVTEEKVVNDNLDGELVDYSDDMIAMLNTDGKTSLLDLSGKMIYETYDNLIEIADEYANFETVAGLNYIIDENGEDYLENNQYNDLFLPVEDNHVIFSVDEGFGIVSLDGNVITDKTYANVSYINTGVMTIYSDTEPFYVNLDGEEIIEPGEYPIIYNFSDGLGLVLEIK